LAAKKKKNAGREPHAIVQFQCKDPGEKQPLGGEDGGGSWESMQRRKAAGSKGALFFYFL